MNGFMKDYMFEDYKSPRSCRVKYVFGMNAADSVRGDYHHSINLIFIFFIRGKGNINIEGASYEFNEGDVIMLNPSEFFLCNIDNNILHERITLITNVNAVNAFPGDSIDLFSAFYNREKREGNILSAEVVKKHGIDKLFYELLEIERGSFQTKETLAMCKMMEILCKIGETREDSTNVGVERSLVGPFIESVLHYVEKNFTEDITIGTIAEYFGVHRSYLSHEFNRQMGISLWNYIIMRRLYKFNSLMTANGSAEEVAYKVGFNNYSNFFRLYKKHMQMTPMEYKRQCNRGE